MTKKKISAILITVLTLLILTASVPPARAQFVLSSWDYPDAYGQGILSIVCYENSTGGWVQVDYIDFFESAVIELPAGGAIKLKVLTTFNATRTGATSLADGKLYHRHNVTVTNLLDEVIFSQQNFTYIDSADEETGIYDYEYDVILNFISEYGEYYTVTVIYEIVW